MPRKAGETKSTALAKRDRAIAHEKKVDVLKSKEKGCLSGCLWFVLGNGAVLFLCFLLLEHVPDDITARIVAAFEKNSVRLAFFVLVFTLWFWLRKRKD